MADNVEVTHQSGISRFLNSIFAAVCLGPAIILMCCFVLGWNEQRAVCDDKAISQGSNLVKVVGCDDHASTDTDLVQFTCDMKKGGLTPLTADGDFQGVIPANSERLIGLQTTAEMLQCVESKSSQTTKDSVGGGTTTKTTYTYSTAWRSGPIDSSAFKTSTQSWRTNCGTANPAWPTGVPRSSTKWVSEAKVGSFRVSRSYLSNVRLSRPLIAAGNFTGWTLDGNTFSSDAGNANGIGNVRVSFAGNDWSRPRVTVLGVNSGGMVTRWTASNSWMCSGFSVGTLREGTHSKEELFAALAAEASGLTIVLRIVFLLVMWAGFSLLFKPLEVTADCIPFVGPYIGDFMSYITTILACPMACCCGLGIIGFMWVFMRPLVGIPLVLLCLLSIGGAVAWYVKYNQDKDKKKKDENGDTPAPDVEAAPQVAAGPEEATVVES